MTAAAVTIPYQSGRTGTCPLCRTRPLWAKPIYNQSVCKKCYYAFANRRQLAYVIDAVLFFVPVTVVNALILTAVGRTFGGGWLATQLAAAAIGLPLTCLFVMKDGFGGRSPGKRFMDLLVLDDTTAQPIAFAQSFKRNAVLLWGQIPVVGGVIGLIVIIRIAVKLLKGYRLGDRYANTRVIWRRYARLPVFGGTALVCEACGYDLQGNTSGVCPECGTPVSDRVAARLASTAVPAV